MLGAAEQGAVSPAPRTEDKLVQPEGGAVKLVMVAVDWPSYSVKLLPGHTDMSCSADNACSVQSMLGGRQLSCLDATMLMFRQHAGDWYTYTCLPAVWKLQDVI